MDSAWVQISDPQLCDIGQIIFLSLHQLVYKSEMTAVVTSQGLCED